MWYMKLGSGMFLLPLDLFYIGRRGAAALYMITSLLAFPAYSILS
jgi:hypothetical protein